MSYPNNARGALAAITLALLLNVAPAWGWGIVAPNGEDSNQYYQVIDTSLVRFDCPDGEIPTGTSCDDNRTPLGDYPTIRLSIKTELEERVTFYEDEIRKLETSLKEEDADTKAFRAAIAQYETKKKEQENLMLETEQQVAGATKNLALIEEQLTLVTEALAQKPSGEELKRLLARQERYQALKLSWSTKKDSLVKTYESEKAERERLARLIVIQNQKLSTHLQTLEVSSSELEDMKAYLAAYRQEKRLLPELDARVTAKVAYELAVWDDLGAPELFARMLKHVEICKLPKQGKKPGSPHPGQQNPGQQNPVQQNPAQQNPVQQNPAQQNPVKPKPTSGS